MRSDAVLDHIVFAVPDLARASEELTEQLGTRPLPGGPHRGLGTHNALVVLADGQYLEVIGPDPAQPEPAVRRPFGIDALTGPRMAGWAVRVADLDAALERLRAAGQDPGVVHELTREHPDRGVLSWRVAVNPGGDSGGVTPFLIDWGATPHPTEGIPPVGALVSLTARHPEPDRILARADALGLPFDVIEGPVPQLSVVLQMPAGEVTLR